MLKFKQRAFTLTEVLIALALLGIIAAFTIPKIMQGTQDAQRLSTFKETLAIFNQVLYEGMLSGDIYQEAYGQYVAKRLNAIKVCPNDYIAEGCHTHANASPQAGFILPNGVAIRDLDPRLPYICANQVCGDHVLIDWNGVNGSPNIPGQDILSIMVSYGTGNYFYQVSPGVGTLLKGVDSGRIGPNCATVHLALYNKIYDTAYTSADCIP